MDFSKVSFEESLERDVVATGKCVSCGTCVLVCPFTCLELVNQKPKIARACKVCGICAQTCPRFSWSWPAAERYVFGRPRKPEEESGIIRRLVTAQAQDPSVSKVCQDGGVVTALLLYALENGLIDGAVVAGTCQEKPFLPVPKLVTAREELLQCAGTKYCYSPNVLALAEVVKQKKKNVAFVGTPCEIHAVRKMQMAGLKKYTSPIRLLIGLMCSECFTYGGLMEKHIRDTLHLDLSGIRKMDIKGKMLVTAETGTTHIALAEIKQYARGSCHYCDDFSSELADISAGGLGLDGKTFTILRTEKGEELFSKAENAGLLSVRAAENEEFALSLLRKLSIKKRERVKTAV